MKFLLRPAAAATLVAVAACAPITPAPTGDSWPSPPGSSTPAPEPSAPPPAKKAPPPQPEPAPRPSAAVQSLLDKGWSRYRQDDYQGALVLAERAQRIDARSPEVYLLMASAQFSLYRYSVAEQLVRKGLSFSGGRGAVNRQLQSLLNRIRVQSR